MSSNIGVSFPKVVLPGSTIPISVSTNGLNAYDVIVDVFGSTYTLRKVKGNVWGGNITIPKNFSGLGVVTIVVSYFKRITTTTPPTTVIPSVEKPVTTTTTTVPPTSTTTTTVPSTTTTTTTTTTTIPSTTTTITTTKPPTTTTKPPTTSTTTTTHIPYATVVDNCGHNVEAVEYVNGEFAGHYPLLNLPPYNVGKFDIPPGSIVTITFYYEDKGFKFKLNTVTLQPYQTYYVDCSLIPPTNGQVFVKNTCSVQLMASLYYPNGREIASLVVPAKQEATQGHLIVSSITTPITVKWYYYNTLNGSKQFVGQNVVNMNGTVTPPSCPSVSSTTVPPPPNISGIQAHLLSPNPTPCGVPVKVSYTVPQYFYKGGSKYYTYSVVLNVYDTNGNLLGTNVQETGNGCCPPYSGIISTPWYCNHGNPPSEIYARINAAGQLYQYGPATEDGQITFTIKVKK